MPRWLYFLLIFAILAIVLNFFSIPPPVIFVVAALGIVPLAGLIGQAVEEVAERTSERIGGLLFATFGNATELIIGILALTKGLTDVVRASIIGSILGNLLLVLGIAVCIGGFKHGRLRFETRPASQYASLLALSIGGLLVPTIADLFATRSNQPLLMMHNVQLADIVSVLLLIGYIAFIAFSVFRVGDKYGEEEEYSEDSLGMFAPHSAAAIMRLLAYRQRVAHSATPGKTGVLNQIDGTVHAIVAHETATHGATATQNGMSDGSSRDAKEATDYVSLDVAASRPVRQAEKGDQRHEPSLWRGLLLLAIATIGVSVLSEILVSSIGPMTVSLHWNPAFVGLVFLPLIGGIPEYFNTISMALDKRMGMVLAASAGSSIQIALLMTPILVLTSLFMPARLDLVFSLVELAVLALATFLFSEITKDGELVWLEGLLLILLYAIMGSTVFLFGGGQL